MAIAAPEDTLRWISIHGYIRMFAWGVRPGQISAAS